MEIIFLFDFFSFGTNLPIDILKIRLIVCHYYNHYHNFFSLHLLFIHDHDDDDDEQRSFHCHYRVQRAEPFSVTSKVVKYKRSSKAMIKGTGCAAILDVI